MLNLDIERKNQHRCFSRRKCEIERNALSDPFETARSSASRSERARLRLVGQSTRIDENRTDRRTAGRAAAERKNKEGDVRR